MPMRKAKPGQASNGEARLARAVRRFTGKGPESYAPEDWASTLESYRLPILYAGQFVAFRDHYRAEGKALRLLRREVLCHSRSMTKVQKFLTNLSDEEKRNTFFDYTEGPDAPLHGR